MRYQKPYKTYHEQVELWIARGLIIEDLTTKTQPIILDPDIELKQFLTRNPEL